MIRGPAHKQADKRAAELRAARIEASASQPAPVTKAQAATALDELDDCARMGTGVDAHGPRGVLERFISQQPS